MKLKVIVSLQLVMGYRLRVLEAAIVCSGVLSRLVCSASHIADLGLNEH